MGDANTPSRPTYEEQQASKLKRLNRTIEVTELRRRLRETVATWLAELSAKKREKVAPLMEKKYNFADPPKDPFDPFSDFPPFPL